MKKLGCDKITITNLGINQLVKVDQLDIVKELKNEGYKLYDDIPFGVIRNISENAFDLIVNQNKEIIEFWSEVYPYGDDYYEYELIATMSITDLVKGTDGNYYSTSHIEDICTFAKYGFKEAEFPREY